MRIGEKCSNFQNRRADPIGHWRLCGAKLREIRELYGISESGVNRACGRFEKMMERDKDLREKIKRLTGNLK
jgi:hypothetical protein